METKEIPVLDYSEWIQEAEGLFGDDPTEWKFECVRCGHVQSVGSVQERNPHLSQAEIAKWVFYSCEGRINDDVGCDWSLGGLLQIHEREVRFRDEESGWRQKSPVFDYARS